MNTTIILLSTIYFLLAVTRLRTAYLAFVVMLPFTPRYFAISIGASGMALSLKRIMAYCLVVGIAASLAMRREGWKRFAGSLKDSRTFLWLLGILYAIKLIATVVHSEPATLIYWADELLITAVVLLLTMRYIDEGHSLKRLILVILAGLVISQMLAFVEYRLGRPLLQGIVEVEIETAGRDVLAGRERGGSYRTMVGYDNPLLYAEYLCVVGMLLISRLGASRALAAAAALVAIPFVLMTTGARSGFVVLGSTLLVLFALAVFRRFPRVVRTAFVMPIILLCGLVMWSAIVAVANPQLVQRATTWLGAGQQFDVSTYERAAQYYIVMHAVRKDPVFGLGMKRNFTREIEDLNHLDNYYLRLLLEAGYAGLTVFLVMIGHVLLKIIYPNLLNAPTPAYRRITLALFAAVVSLALYKLFISMPYNNVYFYLVAAIAYNMRREPERFMTYS